MKILNPQAFSRLPDAVLFDTDNTLYAYEPCHAAAIAAVLVKANQELGIPTSTFAEVYQQARLQIKETLSGTAASHSRLLYMQRSIEILGLGSQLLTALDLEQTYWRTFLTEAQLFDGVMPLLDELRLLGIPMAIVTDLTAQIQFRKLIYFGLDTYFDAVVTSEESSADKPHRSSFALALQKLNPEGTEVWMIGDDAQSDIYGARAAIGARTVQKLHSGVAEGKAECAPDASFSSFEQLRKFIERLPRD